ncbi:hypothetical protein J4E82_007414 [Alternaria postmessia]|uniref:uncharacterized protein n=1 Tax=Alternaria postmessia TaxID=1187938 RepID=UPI0022248084|nr:uncharacterized protein J4E82_007414 [Alternaria postmessia]KAH6863163.1 hypothetical protein B0T12DRAFT_490989 [Alternaria alternata]KAI5373873.1 hypothetical protein J4E82_007414 [Alternaria postmessia]
MRSISPYQSTNAVIVELYCPAKDLTITNFLITSSAAHKDIIEAIKARFKFKYKIELQEVWPCDINGEPIRTSKPGELIDGVVIEGDPVCNFSNIRNGEVIMIRLSRDERLATDTNHETVLYLGGSMGQEAFKMMGREDRRDLIRKFRREEAVERRNVIRLTLPYADVVSGLAEARYSASLSSRIIDENWKIAQVNALDRDCLGALAILSQATCGQGWVIKQLLMKTIMERPVGERTLLEIDILGVIERLYREADAVGSTWEEVGMSSAHDTIMSYVTGPSHSFL